MWKLAAWKWCEGFPATTMNRYVIKNDGAELVSVEEVSKHDY
jgi:hypothetical protein